MYVLIQALSMQHLIQVCMVAANALFFVSYEKPFVNSILIEHLVFIVGSFMYSVDEKIILDMGSRTSY